VLPVASGWFVAIAVVLTTAFWLGLFFVRATSTRRREYGPTEILSPVGAISKHPARLCRPGPQASRAHPRGKPGFSTLDSGCGRETDCLLEEGGFETSVPRQKDLCKHRDRCRSRAAGAQIGGRIAKMHIWHRWVISAADHVILRPVSIIRNQSALKPAALRCINCRRAEQNRPAYAFAADCVGVGPGERSHIGRRGLRRSSKQELGHAREATPICSGDIYHLRNEFGSRSSSGGRCREWRRWWPGNPRRRSPLPCFPRL
jgi:hypothetical protein